MLFDKLCTFVEHHQPRYQAVMRHCEVFTFSDEDADAAVNEQWDNGYEMMSVASEHFFLPFIVTCVDTPKECVVLWRSCSHKEPHDMRTCPDRTARGFVTPFNFLFATPVNVSRFRKTVEIWDGGEPYREDKALGVFDGAIKINGLMRTGERSIQFDISYSALRFWAMLDNRVIEERNSDDMDKEHRQDMFDACMGPVLDTIRLLLFINQPSRFVVEAVPKKVRPRDAPKIPRTQDRSTFTILRPKEIKTRYGISGETTPTGRHVVAHPRRAHERLLSDERYTHKRGQRVYVPATWVGPTDARIGNKTYKVRLDL